MISAARLAGGQLVCTCVKVLTVALAAVALVKANAERCDCCDVTRSDSFDLCPCLALCACLAGASAFAVLVLALDCGNFVQGVIQSPARTVHGAELLPESSCQRPPVRWW